MVNMSVQETNLPFKQQLFTLLHSHASNHFQARAYESANKFFSAAYMYSEVASKAKIARVMAVCNLALKALDR